VIDNYIKHFQITTLGCKINIYESESISSSLKANGFILETDPGKSGLIIVNSCAVTSKAEAKTRHTLRKLRNCNKDAVIILCGCAVETVDKNQNIFPDADILIGTKDKDKIIDAINIYLAKDTKEKNFYFRRLI
jgi:threonylcarbamoyladenosine tRNA methylthiotransferase MtaB